MAEFLLNKSVDTPDNAVEVTVSPDAPLPVGLVRFQLVVFDDANNASEPAFLEVLIRDSQKPTAVLDGPQEPVEFGQSFKLSGARSRDAEPGSIVRYQWTMVPIVERPTPDR